LIARNEIFKSVRKFKSSLLLIFSATLSGQDLGSISGKVLDNKGPVEFANVYLALANDSARIEKVAVTDSIGRYNIEEVLPGSYILKVYLIGYGPFRSVIKLDTVHRHIEIPVVQLERNGKLLDGVDIIARQNIIKRTPQGFSDERERKYHTSRRHCNRPA
jgi:hypothetical protein